LALRRVGRAQLPTSARGNGGALAFGRSPPGRILDGSTLPMDGSGAYPKDGRPADRMAEELGEELAASTAFKPAKAERMLELGHKTAESALPLPKAGRADVPSPGATYALRSPSRRLRERSSSREGRSSRAVRSSRTSRSRSALPRRWPSRPRERSRDHIDEKEFPPPYPPLPLPFVAVKPCFFKCIGKQPAPTQLT